MKKCDMSECENVCEWCRHFDLKRKGDSGGTCQKDGTTRSWLDGCDDFHCKHALAKDDTVKPINPSVIEQFIGDFGVSPLEALTSKEARDQIKRRLDQAPESPGVSRRLEALAVARRRLFHSERGT